jgi:hypothetical protein
MESFTFTTSDPALAARIVNLMTSAPLPAELPPTLTAPNPGDATASDAVSRIVRALQSRPFPPRQQAMMRLLYDSEPNTWVTTEQERECLVQAGLVGAHENARNLVRAQLAAIASRFSRDFPNVRWPLLAICEVRWDGVIVRHRLIPDAREAIRRVAAQIFNGQG